MSGKRPGKRDTKSAGRKGSKESSKDQVTLEIGKKVWLKIIGLFLFKKQDP